MKNYIDKCKEVYNIAFYQWRREYPSKVKNRFAEIENLIETGIEYTFRTDRGYSKSNGILANKKKYSILPKNFEKKYEEMVENDCENFRINIFE
mgnify:CR=1 FL=1